MKFFTQDLLERFASEDDDIALSAQDELEERSEQYRTHWKKIKNKLPARFCEMQESYYFHDAKILSPSSPSISLGNTINPFLFLEGSAAKSGISFPGASGSRSLLLALQMNAPPREVLLLCYQGVTQFGYQQPSIQQEPHPVLEWQYDEVFIEDDKCELIVCHFIRLSAGVEVSVHFQAFDYVILKTPEADEHQSKRTVNSF